MSDPVRSIHPRLDLLSLSPPRSSQTHPLFVPPGRAVRPAPVPAIDIKIVQAKPIHHIPTRQTELKDAGSPIERRRLPLPAQSCHDVVCELAQPEPWQGASPARTRHAVCALARSAVPRPGAAAVRVGRYRARHAGEKLVSRRTFRSDCRWRGIVRSQSNRADPGRRGRRRRPAQRDSLARARRLPLAFLVVGRQLHLFALDHHPSRKPSLSAQAGIPRSLLPSSPLRPQLIPRRLVALLLPLAHSPPCSPVRARSFPLPLVSLALALLPPPPLHTHRRRPFVASSPPGRTHPQYIGQHGSQAHQQGPFLL